MAKVTSESVFLVAVGMLKCDELKLNESADVFQKTGNLIDETDAERLHTVRVLLAEVTKLATLESAERFDKRARRDWIDVIKRIEAARAAGTDVGFPPIESSKIPTSH